MTFQGPRSETTQLGSLRAQLAAALRRRPKIATLTLIVAVALVNATLYQAPLFAFAVARLDPSTFSGMLTLATLFVLVSVATTLLLTLMSLVSQHLLKPLCVLAALFNACAIYFLQTYGVLLDKTMMGNILNTDLAEATALWHPKLLLYLAAFGLGPSLVLLLVRLRPVSRLRLVAFAAVTFAGGVGWLYATSSTWLWIDKHARSLGGMILPWSYTINLARYQTSKWAAARQAEPLPDATFATDEKTVVVLVIGESARARNFSMYGYPRRTNPVLSASGAVALANTSACATYTTEAVLCILSHDNPGMRLAGAAELLPSYLQRHGIDVIWRSNNWGEPPLRVGSYERAEELKQHCRGAMCTHDDLLLGGLVQRIRNSTARRVFVVLHQSGSHGPSYATKYPSSFEAFRPVCRSVDLNQCSAEELVNAYDNSILYTDHVVGRAIDLLKELPEVPSTLLYISDHGESLGEYGLYLHGTPISIAPNVQKDIPFIVWMSQSFKSRNRINESTLARRSSHSQANVFHSVMGAFNMHSIVYSDRLDIYSSYGSGLPGR